MSSQTTNLHLIKPADGEVADIGVINGNMDTIDAAVWQCVRPYMAGDTISGVCRVGGWLTSSSTELNFQIPLMKPVVGTVSISYMKLWVRHVNGGYILNGVDATANCSIPTWPVASMVSGIQVVYTTSTAITVAPNNTPIGVMAQFTLTVS